MEQIYQKVRSSFQERFPSSEKTRALGQKLNMWVAENEVTPYVFSPHPDDVELSMGGEALTLNRLSGGKLVHAVVFSEDVRQKNQEQRSLTEVRKQEVQEADSLLGIKEQQIHFLGEVDLAARHSWLHQIPLRRGRNLLSSFPYLTGNEEVLVDRLKQQFADLVLPTPNHLVFVPLGGFRRHRDHLLVHMAARGVFEKYRIAYYDEFPYLRGPIPSGPLLFRMVTGFATFEEHQDKRRESIEAFQSQIPLLFPNGFPSHLPSERIYIPRETQQYMQIDI